MEELEERHQVEIKVYKQKVKHLHYEHQNNVTNLKTQSETDIKLLADTHKTKEQSMKKIVKKSKAEMNEVEISHEDVIKNLKQVIEHPRHLLTIHEGA